jgi:guanine deaminase
MRPVIIRGGTLLAHARARPAPADILIRDGRIAAIEAPGAPAPGDALAIDAADRILIPGLVNAHTHGHGNLSKGAGDRWTLELLLNAGPWISRFPTVEEKHLTVTLGAVEMLLKGCTACYDLFYEFPAPSLDGIEAVGRAYDEAGMRAVVGVMMADRTFYAAIPGLREALPDGLRPLVERMTATPGSSQLALCREALRRWPFDPERVRLALAPTVPLHCDDAFMTGAAALAREFGTGYHTHLGESRIQAVSGLKRYGCTLTAHLERLGILGPNMTAAHAVWLDPDDIRRLADHGAAVAHNAGSNMRLGSGIAAIRRMRNAGMRVGIGTDGCTCSDNLNMFEAMRLASFASHLRGPDYEQWLATAEVLEMATDGSAGLLGFDGKLGRIAPGYCADIVFLDAGHINYLPLTNLVNQLVHIEDGTAVDKVMVGGRLVVDGRKLLTIDLAALRRRVETAVDRLAAMTAEARGLAERLEPVVGSFCRALAAEPYHIHHYGGPPGIDRH